MSSSATGVGMTICFLGAILLILTQKSSQKFGDVLGILYFILALQIEVDYILDVIVQLDGQNIFDFHLYC